ncbi:MAG: C2 family cysteine protease [Chloroflexota bacterium]
MKNLEPTKKEASPSSQNSQALPKNSTNLDKVTRISGYKRAEGNLFATNLPDDDKPCTVKSPKWLGEESIPITYAEKEIHANDLAQGKLRNCFFVAALAVIANQNCDIIRNAIQDNGDETFTVTYYEKKGNTYRPIEITVTPEFPVREVYDKENKQWVANADVPHIGPGDNELWPRLMEKAYAQWKGKGNVGKGYEILNKGGYEGDVYEALTGVDSEYVTDMTSLTLEKLGQMQDEGFAISLSSLDTTDGDDKFYPVEGKGRLSTSHAYWIESIDVSNDKIVIRNPWGYRSSSDYRLELSYDELTQNFDRYDINPLQKVSWVCKVFSADSAICRTFAYFYKKMGRYFVKKDQAGSRNRDS